MGASNGETTRDRATDERSGDLADADLPPIEEAEQESTSSPSKTIGQNRTRSE
jgi:hypothetical protein